MRNIEYPRRVGQNPLHMLIKYACYTCCAHDTHVVAVLAIAVMVGLTMGGLALIDANKPRPTIPRGLT